jgi:hypothetical protein
MFRWLIQTAAPPVKPVEPGFDLFEVWKKYEELAQHFNDLLMRLRSQSLGAVAAFATAASVLLKGDAIGTDFRWGSLVAVFSSLSVFWLAIWMLDFLYYNRLLLGAVDALEKIEDESTRRNRIFEINLSTRIEAVVARRMKYVEEKRDVHGKKKSSLKRAKGLWWFYGLVMGLLLLATGISCWQCLTTRVTRVELAVMVVSSVTPDTVLLTDGKITRAISVAPTTEVNVNGQKATVAELKPGMTAKAMLDPDPSKALRIDATGK